jgi:hypothetical protein
MFDLRGRSRTIVSQDAHTRYPGSRACDGDGRLHSVRIDVFHRVGDGATDFHTPHYNR